MPIRGHTLTQARLGHDGKSTKNTGTSAGHIFYQSKKSGEKGGLAAATGRGLKHRNKI